jgi:hypothetical protein
MVAKKKSKSKKIDGLQTLFEGGLSKDIEKLFKKLNIKQQRFLIHFLVDGLSGSESYRKAYDRKMVNDNCASTGANRVVTSSDINKIIKAYSGKNWINIVDAKKALTNGLEATKTVFSKLNEPMEIDDHPTRIKAAVEVLKSNGEYTEKHEHSGDPDRPLITVIKRVIVKNGT